MRYLLLSLPCLFACSPSDEGVQQGSIPATPTITEVTTSSPSESFTGTETATNNAIGQAIADGFAASMQTAFDEQAAVYAQGGTEEEIATARDHFDATQPIPESNFLDGYYVSADAGGRSALQLLQFLTASSGLILDATSYESELAGIPEMQIEGLSKIEALEGIAAEMGLVPLYPKPFSMGDAERTISFTQEARSAPTSFAGPFLIQIAKIEEQAPHAVGSVHLTARAIGIPESALMANEAMFETFRIEEVLSNQSEDLRSRQDIQRLSSPQCMGSMVTMSVEVELKGLLAGTERIDTLSGTVSVKRPSSVTKVDFGSLSPGLRAAGEFTVLLKEVGTNTTLKVSTQRSSEVAVIWAPDQANGDPLGILNSNSFGFDNAIDATLSTPETPSQLSIKLIETELLTVPFELKNIEFEHASEQPKELTELEFDHAQPISVVFVEFKDRDSPFPEVLLRTVSHANKDARTLHIKLIYLNEKNKEIKNSFTSLNPTFNFDANAIQPFVQAGGIETTTQTAFFMPRETVSVQISVHEVEFMDGTTWKAEE
jgi:hypothetical protein